ncbi:hypothetical protein ES703_115870 [subsurface metagenome]
MAVAELQAISQERILEGKELEPETEALESDSRVEDSDRVQIMPDQLSVHLPGRSGLLDLVALSSCHPLYVYFPGYRQECPPRGRGDEPLHRSSPEVEGPEVAKGRSPGLCVRKEVPRLVEARCGTGSLPAAAWEISLPAAPSIILHPR